MKIAINCWVLRNKQLDGIGYFTVNTIQRMIVAHPEVSFVLLCDRNFHEDYFKGENVVIKRIFPPYRHPLLYVFFLECILPFYLRSLKPNLMLSAEGFCSLISSCKQIPVIYDINFEHHPENLTLKNRLYFRFFFSKFARKAVRIATISEYSKKDISNYYKIDHSKIDNVSCGINASFSKLSNEVIHQTRIQLTNGKPYFFFVGSMHPRKNIQRLIEAFELFKTKTGSDMKLVISGAILWKTEAMKERFQNSSFKEDIVFTGRVTDEQLGLYLGSACALAFVPIFEGFGLPIVEAFQAGVPVVCSNTTSLPEVAGNAAVFVNPMDINDIARGLTEIALMDAETRSECILKGDIQKNQFSWNRTAELLWNCIQKGINEN